MFADHVVAEGLGLFDVELQGLVGRGSVEAVGPPALVERAELENRLSVQTHPAEALVVEDYGRLAKGRVAFNAVEDLVSLLERYLQGIEVRLVGRPQLRLGDGDAHRLSGIDGGKTDCLALGAAFGGIANSALADIDFNFGTFGIAANRNGHLERTARDIGHGKIVGDMGGSHGLKPYALPDAGNGGVPYALRIVDLLSARLDLLVGGVGILDVVGLDVAVVESVMSKEKAV